ncbi:unnamed protein product [Lampetra fluviatilis]
MELATSGLRIQGASPLGEPECLVIFDVQLSKRTARTQFDRQTRGIDRGGWPRSPRSTNAAQRGGRQTRRSATSSGTSFAPEKRTHAGFILGVRYR